jgi:DNA repair protein RecN (Recombination protein N)
MLSYLRIRGLALLDDVTLELVPGMNVLTGETGAGKSIIVDALALLRGGRGRAELVRAGEEHCIVDAQFELAPPLARRVHGVLAEHGLPTDETEAVVVQRTLPRSGRGRTLVQAELTTQPVLAALGELLVDICSQHEHHSLTRVSRHVELLDAYARAEAELGRYQATYAEYRDVERSLADLRTKAGNGASRADYLRFQVEELERIAPQPGELEALKNKLVLLRDARSWAEFAAELHDSLEEAEDAILNKLRRLADRAHRGAEHSARLAAIAEQLTQAENACEEADRLAQRFGAELELDPAELVATEERVHDLVTLQKKHGKLEDIAELTAGMRRELDELEHAEERVALLEAQAEALRVRAVSEALTLRASRERAAAELGHALEQELAALHLPRARIEARVEALEECELGPRGLDRVEFLFSANTGEPLAPLNRVASGGELSRVLLALKGVLSTSGSVSTYVFDEVDAGVGGAVAAAIAQRLARAAAGSQVLCITHLPQIAAYAAAHFHVEKHVQGARTITRVVRLSNEQRVEEIARMLGGARVTESAREHARELLEEARRSGFAGTAARAPGAPGTSKPELARRTPRRQR